MRICAFGDSGVLGHLDPDQLGWAGRLQGLARREGKPVTVYNLGIRGDSSQQVRNRWRAEADARLPSTDSAALLFSFGVNDATRIDGGGPRVGVAQSVENFRAIAREAKARAATFFVGSFPIGEQNQPSRLGAITMEVRNDWIAAVDAQLKRAAVEEGVPYLSLFEALRDDPDWKAAVSEADGVHLSPQAHSRVADMVAAWSPWAELIRSAT
jgi:lysophospholipase L1-like esterase